MAGVLRAGVFRVPCRYCGMSASCISLSYCAVYPDSDATLLNTPQSMLLSFSLTSAPVLSQDHYTDGYLLRTFMRRQTIAQWRLTNTNFDLSARHL